MGACVCTYMICFILTLLRYQTGIPPPAPPYVPRMALGSPELDCMRDACRLARRMLDLACSLAKPNTTTNEIDAEVRDTAVFSLNILLACLPICWC